MDSSVERLHEVIDALAAVDLGSGSVSEELLALERARARLDAEVARRLREFDRSCEWAAHGSRSAAARASLGRHPNLQHHGVTHGVFDVLDG